MSAKFVKNIDIHNFFISKIPIILFIQFFFVTLQCSLFIFFCNGTISRKTSPEDT